MMCRNYAACEMGSHIPGMPYDRFLIAGPRGLDSDGERSVASPVKTACGHSNAAET